MQKDIIELIPFKNIPTIAPFLIDLYDAKKFIGTVCTNIDEINEVMEQVSCEYMNFKPFKNWNFKRKKCKK